MRKEDRERKIAEAREATLRLIESSVFTVGELQAVLSTFDPQLPVLLCHWDDEQGAYPVFGSTCPPQVEKLVVTRLPMRDSEDHLVVEETVDDKPTGPSDPHGRRDDSEVHLEFLVLRQA